MAKARIAVIGAGLMGHGIAQVFALAGHDVTIYDSVQGNLDTAKARILTNLKDLGDDQSCRRAGDAGRRSRTSSTRGRLRGRGSAGGFAAQAKIVRRNREAREAGHHPRQQYIGHSDHVDHAGIAEARTRARHPLVEPALSGAAGRSDRDAMDHATGRRLHDEAARRRRQKARACEERRARLHRQPVCNMRCGARRSHWSSKASAMPRPWTM